MGVPITKYSVLRKLGEIKGDDPETREIEKSLEQFNVFAFILHDPEADISFDHKINELFDRLDYLTGPKMLFFALVNPNLYSGDQITSRLLYHGYNPEYVADIIKSTDSDYLLSESQSIYGLSIALGIPYKSLPVIVITNNLKSHKIFWIKTGVEHLERQFQELGYFASRYEQIVKDWSYEQKFLERKIYELNFLNDHSATFLSESLAKTITQFLAVKISNNVKNPNYYDAVARAKTFYNEIEIKISRFQNLHETKTGYLDQSLNNASYDGVDQNTNERFSASSNLNVNDDINEYKPYSPNIPPLFNESDNPSEENYIKLQLIKGACYSTKIIESEIDINEFAIPDIYLERESYILLRTAQSLYSFYLGPEMIEAVVDWSPPMISLTKLFELEINLSIVHWLRREFGIIMPDFYNKQQPNISAEFNLVNFNKGNGIKWYPPSIGQSEICFKEYLKSIGAHNKKWIKATNGGFSKTETNFMIEKWENIRVIRNQCAHQSLTNKQMALGLKKLFEDLNKIEFYRKSFNLKSLLNGDFAY